MMPPKAITGIALAILLGLARCGQGVVVDAVTVGNPGNAGDPTPFGVFGSVSYNYRISKTEVTNAEYCEFLNAVARQSNSRGLYNASMGTHPIGGIVQTLVGSDYVYTVKADAVGKGPGGTDYSYANKPVIWVSFYDAVRYANWLHNGQGGASTTEFGAYTPAAGNSIVRHAGAKYFIPTDDEWFKAAYYNPLTQTYYEYPTRSETPPNNNLPSADTGNSANFNDATGKTPTGATTNYRFTDVGAYQLSASPYGTFDQGGNAFEWTESYLDTGYRRIRGGSSTDSNQALAASGGYANSSTSEYAFSGF